jgi:hypothetical protein
MAHIDSLAIRGGVDQHENSLEHEIDHELDELTRPAGEFAPRFLSPSPTTEPGGGTGFEDHLDESTRLASLDGIAAMERARNHGPSHDDRTRAVNIRNDPSISDIDWDLD